MALPIVLVPGLLCTARLYAEQIPALQRLAPVTVADHTRDDSMAAIAERVLADAPPRFALAGLSMGGYVAFEIVRQAPERVARLALLSTSARLDPPEISERRRRQIALAEDGRFGAVAGMQFPLLVHRSRLDDWRNTGSDQPNLIASPRTTNVTANPTTIAVRRPRPASVHPT